MWININIKERKFLNHRLRPIVESYSAENMKVLMAERADLVFYDKVINGTDMKWLISILIDYFGMVSSHILDQVKILGFQQATATSISLGIDDL